MPRPPPPAEAFTRRGRSASVGESGADSTGTPAASISFLLSILEPICSIEDGSGPIQQQPGVDDPAREVGVLREEAVAGVDRGRAGALRGLEDQVGAQVGVGRRRAGQVHGQVGLADVRQVRVGVGEDRDGVDARADGRCGRRGWRSPPRLATSTRCMLGPHPEDAEVHGAFDRLVVDDGQADAQDGAGVARVDDAVVVDHARRGSRERLSSIIPSTISFIAP